MYKNGPLIYLSTSMFVELKPLTTSERGLSNIIGINDLINRASTWYPKGKRKPGRQKNNLGEEDFLFFFWGGGGVKGDQPPKKIA